MRRIYGDDGLESYCKQFLFMLMSGTAHEPLAPQGLHRKIEMTAIATNESFSTRPLTPTTGLEIEGLDLRRPLAESVRQRLLDLLREHVALVFPNQNLTAEEYVQAIRAFGNPMRQNFKGESLEKDDVVKLVSNAISNKEGKRVYHASYWHTDHTNREMPPAFTALYGVEVPKKGGDTGVLNTREGYASLPDALKEKIAKLQTVNVFSGSASRNASHKAVSLQRTIEDKPAVHPLVVTDPVNGKKAVYLHQGKLEQFVGMTPEASQQLVAELMGHLLKPEFTYRHKWRKGDLLIWDDRSSMHQAYADYDLDDTRVFWRTIIEGQKPV
jgi:taurine dioxygenase